MIVPLLRWLPSAVLMAGIAWSSHQSSWPEQVDGLPDWLLHGCAFGLLAAAVIFGLGAAGKRQPWRAAAVAVATASSYGVIDEFHQSFVAGRDPSVADWMVDTAGAAIVAVATAWWRRR